MISVFSRDPEIAARVREAAAGLPAAPVEWQRDGELSALAAALLERPPRVLIVDAEAFAPLSPVTALLELRRLARDLPLIVLLNGRRPAALRSSRAIFLGRPPSEDALRTTLAGLLVPQAARGGAR